jgi:hypothetical protein
LYLFILKLFSLGNFPGFMTGDRIVGGEAASSPIPWQVSVRQGQSGLFVCLFVCLFIFLF